jgi:membrane protein YdbS with pleckstrin-like domain
MEPGYKTTEFWLSAVVTVLAAAMPLFVAYQLLSQEEADLWAGLILAVAAVVVPIVIGQVAKTYTQSRTSLKETTLLSENR